MAHNPAAYLRPSSIYGLPGSTKLEELARWKLDELTGTTAADSVGARTGTLNGGFTFGNSGINGRDGGALEFDGANDYISAAAFEATLDFPLTIEAWVRVRDFATTQPIVTLCNSSNFAGVQIEVTQTAGSVRVLAGPNTGTAGAEHYRYQDHAGAITAEVWQHVVCVLRSMTDWQTYINGLPRTMSAATGTASSVVFDGTSAVAIGHRLADGAKWMKGDIDNVVVRSGAMSAAQVFTQFKVFNSLLAHWTLNEATGLTVSDTVGDRHGTLVGDSDLSNLTVAGRVGNALLFDGVDDRISFGDTLGFQRSSRFSGSCWVATADTNGAIFGKQRVDGAEEGWSLRVDGSGRLEFQLVSDKDSSIVKVRTVESINTGNFKLVGFTHDGSFSPAGIKLFVEGFSVATTADAPTLTGTIINANEFRINGRDSGDPLNAAIDEVKVHLGALTEGDMLQEYIDYIEGPLMISRWKFDEASGLVLANSGVSGLAGTLVGFAGTEWAAGLRGNALPFNGTTQYATVDSTTDTRISTGDFSIAGWLKGAGGQVSKGIFSQYSTSGNNRSFSLRTGTSGLKLRALLDGHGGGSGFGKFKDYTSTAGNILDATWHHVAITFATTGAVLKIYIDGVEDSAPTKTTDHIWAGGLQTVNRPRAFACEHGGTGAPGSFLAASLDEWHSFTRVLPPQEIKALYELNKP